MARIKIPQGVTKEDKLIGPLTLKQFLYLLGGASIVFIAYQYYARQYLYFVEFLFISLIFAMLTVALAFVRINGRSFSTFLGSLFRFIFVSKQRSWDKEPRTQLPAMKVSAQDIKDTKSEIKERKQSKNFQMQIEKLANILDSGGTMNADTRDAVTDQIANFPGEPTAIQEERLGVEDILEGTEESNG